MGGWVGGWVGEWWVDEWMDGRTDGWMDVCMYECMHVRMNVCMYARMNEWMYVCIDMYSYSYDIAHAGSAWTMQHIEATLTYAPPSEGQGCICMCASTYIYMHTYIHTYIHIYIYMGYTCSCFNFHLPITRRPWTICFGLHFSGSRHVSTMGVLR